MENGTNDEGEQRGCQGAGEYVSETRLRKWKGANANMYETKSTCAARALIKYTKMVLRTGMTLYVHCLGYNDRFFIKRRQCLYLNYDYATA